MSKVHCAAELLLKTDENSQTGSKGINKPILIQNATDSSGNHPKIECAFFDVDGTLLSHQLKAVPESALNTIEEMQKKGILCVMASGRSIHEVDELPVGKIPFDAYILLNGQLILDKDRQILSGHPIEGKSKENILHLFEERNIPVLLVEKDGLYINQITDHVVTAQKAISTPLPPVGTYSGNPFYLAIGFIPKEQESWLKAQLPECRLTRWNDYAMDIVNKTGGKLAGIREYLDLVHIDHKNTIAFGDGENDEDMLREVGIGVVMKDCDPAAERAADYMTDTVEEDGIEKAARYCGLIDETRIGLKNTVSCI